KYPHPSAIAFHCILAFLPLLLKENPSPRKELQSFFHLAFREMEAMKLKLFVTMLMVLVAVSFVQNAAAAEAPAPSPTSEATIFIPTFFASLAALAFGLFF
ncbi:hypothetical protein F2P56_033536, partial [Juglans regia]